MNRWPITGGTFPEPEDWRDYLRKVVAHKEFLPDFDLDQRYDYVGHGRLMGQLADELQGTGAEIRMADAALWLIENGSLDEMREMLYSNFEQAPNAYERLLVLVTKQRDRIACRNMFWSIYQKVFELNPNDPRGIKALTDEASKLEHLDLWGTVAKRAPEWLADHIPPLVGDLNPYIWLGAAPPEKRRLLLDAIVKAGPEYVERTLALVFDPIDTPISRAKSLALVSDHPVFAEAIARRSQLNPKG